jgi:hypothetical protein
MPGLALRSQAPSDMLKSMTTEEETTEDRRALAIICSVVKASVPAAFLEDFDDKELSTHVTLAISGINAQTEVAAALLRNQPIVDEASAKGRKTTVHNVATYVYLAAKVAYVVYLSRKQYLNQKGLTEQGHNTLLSALSPKDSHLPDIGIVLADIGIELAKLAE